MGLGPPVCDQCYKILKFLNETKRWICPGCGQTTASTHLWELPKDEQKKYEQDQ